MQSQFSAAPKAGIVKLTVVRTEPARCFLRRKNVADQGIGIFPAGGIDNNFQKRRILAQMNLSGKRGIADINGTGILRAVFSGCIK